MSNSNYHELLSKSIPLSYTLQKLVPFLWNNCYGLMLEPRGWHREARGNPSICRAPGGTTGIPVPQFRHLRVSTVDYRSWYQYKPACSRRAMRRSATLVIRCSIDHTLAGTYMPFISTVGLIGSLQELRVNPAVMNLQDYSKVAETTLRISNL